MRVERKYLYKRQARLATNSGYCDGNLQLVMDTIRTLHLCDGILSPNGTTVTRQMHSAVFYHKKNARSLLQRRGLSTKVQPLENVISMLAHVSSPSSPTKNSLNEKISPDPIMMSNSGDGGQPSTGCLSFVDTPEQGTIKSDFTWPDGIEMSAPKNRDTPILELQSFWSP